MFSRCRAPLRKFAYWLNAWLSRFIQRFFTNYQQANQHEAFRNSKGWNICIESSCRNCCWLQPCSACRASRAIQFMYDPPQRLDCYCQSSPLHRSEERLQIYEAGNWGIQVRDVLQLLQLQGSIKVQDSVIYAQKFAIYCYDIGIDPKISWRTIFIIFEKLNKSHY